MGRQCRLGGWSMVLVFVLSTGIALAAGSGRVGARRAGAAPTRPAAFSMREIFGLPPQVALTRLEQRPDPQAMRFSEWRALERRQQVEYVAGLQKGLQIGWLITTAGVRTMSEQKQRLSLVQGWRRPPGEYVAAVSKLLAAPPPDRPTISVALLRAEAAFAAKAGERQRSARLRAGAEHVWSYVRHSRNTESLLSATSDGASHWEDLVGRHDAEVHVRGFLDGVAMERARLLVGAGYRGPRYDYVRMGEAMRTAGSGVDDGYPVNALYLKAGLAEHQTRPDSR